MSEPAPREVEHFDDEPDTFRVVGVDAAGNEHAPHGTLVTRDALDVADPIDAAASASVMLAARAVRATKLDTRVASLADEVKRMKATDAPSYALLAEHLKLVKALRKEVASTFDPILDAQRKALDETRAQFKRHDGPLAEAETLGKAELTRYDDEQERIAEEKRRELERQLELEARERRLEDALDAELDGRPDDAEQILSEPVSHAPAVVNKATPVVQGVSYTEHWHGEVVSIEKLILAAADELRNADRTKPRPAFKLFNEKTVIKALSSKANSAAKTQKDELLKVPGLRVWSDRTPNVRA